MDTVLRVAIIYLVLFVVFRVLGKRELGTLTPFELVTLMIIPEIVSQSLSDHDSSVTNAIVGVTTLCLLVFATSLLTHRFPRVNGIIENPPKLLVAHGKILEANMNVERMSADELFGEMHRAGVARLEDVEWAILQSDGHVAVIPVRGVGVTPALSDAQPAE